MEDAIGGMIIGFMVGIGLTLLVQAYGRRKVKKALAALRGEDQPVRKGSRETRTSDPETANLARRLAVLEQIVMDNPSALSEQIEGLRHQAL